jgi:phosphatidylserine decarboxylase
MSAQAMTTYARHRISSQFPNLQRVSAPFSPPCRRCHNSRQFSSSRGYRQQNDYKESFGKRLRKALGDTKIKWYPIPVGLGVAFLGFLQLNRINERERKRKLAEEWEDDSWGSLRNTTDVEGRPKRRDRIRPSGPWYD